MPLPGGLGLGRHRRRHLPGPPGTLRILANALVAPIAEEAWIPAAIGMDTRMRFETGGSTA